MKIRVLVLASFIYALITTPQSFAQMMDHWGDDGILQRQKVGNGTVKHSL